ncbi:unnamed protein product [Pelagomonas calceolata]|uniref:H(+)-exporting diphosphatase n=2 Tax=Pelagomonas calceolata TaxID=35677 RepID=A0A8J2SWN5_9STRA|nr:unnamed protein product [Pelagomonas calceolata]
MNARTFVLGSIALAAQEAAHALTTPPASRLGTPERAALGGVGAAWVALGARTFDAANAREAVGALGVATATFEDNIREPAAGFLELTSPLFVLQGVLLLALSANVFASKDAARVSSSIALASATTLLALALAVVAGAPVENGFEFITDPLFITAAVALKAAGSTEEDAFELIRGDVVELATDGGSVAPEDGYGKTLATFYRGSCLVGILVGASFILSPINPIGIFDTESPATHFFRALCGISIALVLAPAQSILWRAAKAGELSANSSRALNAALGLASGLLVVDGRLQVEEGTRQFAQLDPSSAIAKAVELGDVGRSVTNTDAAFSVGLVVALFYVAQAVAPARRV